MSPSLTLYSSDELDSEKLSVGDEVEMVGRVVMVEHRTVVNSAVQGGRVVPLASETEAIAEVEVVSVKKRNA